MKAFERIDQAERQRKLGPHDHERYLLALGDRDEPLDIIDRHVGISERERCSGVAGSANDVGLLRENAS